MKQTFTKLGGALFALLFLVTSSAKATITATWDFAGNEPLGIQSATNYGSGVEKYIDSTIDGVQLYVNTGVSGKFSMNGGTSYIQMTAGTIVRVPVVSTSDVVTISFAGNSGYCTLSSPHTATSAEVAQGYVEFGVSENSTYINSISVNLAYLPPTQRGAYWDFTGHSSDATAIASFSQSVTDQTITVNGINLTVNAHGAKMGDNGNSIYTGKGAKFRVPVVCTDDIVTIYGYSGYCEYSIAGGDATTAAKTIYNVTADDVTKGYVEITNCITINWSYLVGIELTTTQDYFTTATIGSTGWATFSNASATDFTNLAGVVDAYQVTGNTGSAITKATVTTVAANTGLLLNAAAGTYAVPLATTGTDLSATNKLVAVASSTAVGAAPTGYTNFVLVGGSGTASFKKITGANSATVGAGKAYLQLAGSSFAPQLFFYGDVTGIGAVKSINKEDGAYYNLAGQRVAQPQKGLYIVNGKKVIIK